MDEFLFCLEIIKREVNKFNLTMNATTTSHITAATSENINYDIALNRCSYLYRYGAVNLCFTKDCFTKFFSDYKSIAFLLSQWISHPNLTVCSLSNGPALDYLAFLLSYQQCGMFPSLFKDIKLISKHGAWRNTVNIMHQIVTEGNLRNVSIPDLGKIEVIQGDPFKHFTEKLENLISNADVLIMVKKLNLQADLCNQDIKRLIQEFLAALKPDAILFCIDTKPSVTLITNEISLLSGTYLLKPTFINTLINLELRDLYKEIFGSSPVISARGCFFVWQKSRSFLTSSDLIDEVSESVKRLININGNSCSDNSSENSYGRSDANNSHSSTSTQPLSSTFVEKYNELFVSKGNLKSPDKGSRNNDLFHTDSSNISVQNSINFPSSSALQDESFTFGDVDNVLISEISSKNNSFNKSTQTEPIFSSESLKITALTERISNLTATINNLLETNQIDACDEGYNCENHDCLNQMEQMGKGSVCCAATYLSQISCLNKSNSGCPGNILFHSSEEQKCGNYSPHCIHKQSCLPCNKFNSVSLDNNCETISDSSCHELKFSTEKKSVPKLVIPLTNLPSDVITQIISLISKSNMELENL